MTFGIELPVDVGKSDHDADAELIYQETKRTLERERTWAIMELRSAFSMRGLDLERMKHEAYITRQVTRRRTTVERKIYLIKEV